MEVVYRKFLSYSKSLVFYYLYLSPVKALHSCDIKFKHRDHIGHQLINKSDSLVVYLKIDDHCSDDEVVYPDDDIITNLSNKNYKVV